MNRQNIYFRAIALILVIGLSSPVRAQFLNIQNDIFWKTKNGIPINSQGGGIFTFPEPGTNKTKYYWYGVYYEEADTYRSNPSVTLPRCTFKSVTCYSSTDLVNWTFEADVLTKDEALKDGKNTWVGRLGVAYVKEIQQYALFVQHEKEVLIALADQPNGKFRWHQKINMTSMIGTSNTGDQTVFTDEDGKSYLIYSFGNGRNKIYVSEIGMEDGNVNLLDCTEVFRGESREGNCMFKYQGKYYMCASNIYGWDASYAYYLVADDIRGPYTPTNNMQIMKGCEDDYAHVTQTGFFINVKGSKKETVVYCGDRWANFAGNGLGYNQWFPVSFDGATPYFNSLGSWNLNAKTGEWQTASDNNFVKNGSFEADRKTIPSLVKPVQVQLTGWVTSVIEGNEISLDTNITPFLNHHNTEAERKVVIGEKSLQISDKVNFKRKVSQVITSTPYVKLEDGYYNLTASVRKSDGFSKLDMYSISGGSMNSMDFLPAGPSWRKISIDRIPVRDGKIEIGFIAEGNSNSFCFIDDVSLVRTQ